MPSLEELTDKPSAKKPMAIIHGPNGVGKTSFAASAETPVILATEQGADYINVKRAAVKSYNEMLEWIKFLATSENPYKTIIIDSLDHFEPMLHTQIETDQNKKLDQVNGGYYRWRAEARIYWAKFLEYLSKWSARKGGSVIMLAHPMIKEISDPRIDTYSKYVLKLDDKACDFLTESVDLVGFMDISITTTDTTDADRKRAVSNGKRRLYLNECPAYLAKRRPPGLPDYIDLPSAAEGYANFKTAWEKSVGV